MTLEGQVAVSQAKSKVPTMKGNKHATFVQDRAYLKSGKDVARRTRSACLVCHIMTGAGTFPQPASCSVHPCTFAVHLAC